MIKTRLFEMGLKTWGLPPGSEQMPSLPGVPDVRAGNESCGCEGECTCGCPECGKKMLSDVCDSCGYSGSMGCPDCGSITVMTDGEICEACGYSENISEKSCSECGSMMNDGICEACGYSNSLDEGKKKKKGPSKSTQKKIAKTLVKKAGKGKDKKVSLKKLSKIVKSFSKEPYAMAMHMKKLAKK